MYGGSRSDKAHPAGPAVQSRRPGGGLQGSAVKQRGGSKTARSGLLLGFQEETRGTHVMPLGGLWPRQPAAGPALSLALRAEQVVVAGGTATAFSGLEDRQSGR